MRSVVCSLSKSTFGLCWSKLSWQLKWMRERPDVLMIEPCCCQDDDTERLDLNPAAVNLTALLVYVCMAAFALERRPHFWAAILLCLACRAGQLPGKWW